MSKSPPSPDSAAAGEHGDHEPPRKKLSVVTPCFNEQENVQQMYEAVRDAVAQLGDDYDHEHLFIDNGSTDNTVVLLRKICKHDRRVKVIVNSRNFGIVRSPSYGLMQSSGDATIILACDFQDPPELIPRFVASWEEGFKVVVGVKTTSKESALLFFVRKLYYRTINRLSEMDLVENFTGFGLYDRQVMEIFREINDPYPYFRGLISDIGFARAEIEFEQPRRARGITKNRFFALYDMAMLGITNHTKVPLRLATMMGFVLAFLSLLVALAYFIYKLVLWDLFTVGMAPLVIGLFFFSSVQLIFIGIIGEYVSATHTQVLNRPLVVEQERINFDRPD